MSDCDCSSMDLYFYQTVFRKGDVHITSSVINDSRLDFSGCFLYHELRISDVLELPVCNFGFAVGNKLKLVRCILANAMVVANVYEFVLREVKRYGGTIISDGWRYEDNLQELRERGLSVSREAGWRNSVKVGGKDVASDLLKACMPKNLISFGPPMRAHVASRTSGQSNISY